MGGQKFQYDESGGTFFYFLLSFLALILIPATYFYWPRKRQEDPEKERKGCQCDGCVQKKQILSQSEPWKGTKEFLTKVAIVGGWVLLAFLAYKVSQFDYELANFDPYEILGIPVGSSVAEVKKSYKKLSIILHPDKKTGDEKAFMKLTKAYQALTDDEARRNWEKYGNPDGPGAMSFGIALPAWIVEKENTVWVLGLYALVFMVALPTVVGTWWYRSIRFSGDQVLLDTTQLYYYFFHKTPSMMLKRVIMILAASLEFDKRHNSQIVERLSDNEEVPHLIKQLPNLSEKNRERPLCYMYSIKTRAIIHAHLSRISLNPLTLEKDRQYIVKKCPYLIQEQVNCVNQLILLAYAGRLPRLPSIETIENCMKLCPMIVQALWEFKNPLLQLPHVTDDNLKYFMSKKRQVKTLQQLAQLKNEDRKALFRHLSEEQYENVLKVLGQMPYVDFKIQHEVCDDENPNVVTAGAIVTVTVSLKRHDMKTLFGDSTIAESQPIRGDEEHTKDEISEVNGGGDTASTTETKPNVKKPAWIKQKRGGGGKKSNKRPNKQNRVNKERSTTTAKIEESPKVDDATPKSKKLTKESLNLQESDDSDDEDSDSGGGNNKKVSSLDDDQEWEKFQQKLQKRDKGLEGRSKVSHSVHCPYFPEDKQEYWWTYICDRKSKTLLTAPHHITNLVDYEEVQLKFTAPRWPGVYTFTVCLRSDSYIGLDQQQELRLDIKEAPAIPTEHPQWDISESEDEGNGATANGGADDDELSEFATDDEIEEDDE
ncbi:translocation protein SEC63 homolog isoform X2 [Chrysoperla carnea]|uniref:translocation protein SEC63 homolog isoform X2 n=1 Tax=Chrysoperla carnea TaxID=189513 RepID=UPI001D097DD8|nr:translocation protein SEC63 homolog isoform X2 [Chrysoperla carnea]